MTGIGAAQGRGNASAGRAGYLGATRPCVCALRAKVGGKSPRLSERLHISAGVDATTLRTVLARVPYGQNRYKINEVAW